MTNEADVYEALKYRTEVSDGGSRYYYNARGRLHRENGPAIEWPDGTKFWYQCGLLHRADGPAMIQPDGSCEWWINGTEYNECDYNQQLKTQGYA
jgi:hypothetical protein